MASYARTDRFCRTGIWQQAEAPQCGPQTILDRLSDVAQVQILRDEHVRHALLESDPLAAADRWAPESPRDFELQEAAFPDWLSRTRDRYREWNRQAPQRTAETAVDGGDADGSLAAARRRSHSPLHGSVPADNVTVLMVISGLPINNTTVSLTDARTRLSEPVTRAAAGESIVITKRCKPTVRLSRVFATRRPVNLTTLRALSARMPAQAPAACECVRVMTEFSAALSVKDRTAQLEAVHRVDALAVFAELIDASFEVLPVSSLDVRSAPR